MWLFLFLLVFSCFLHFEFWDFLSLCEVTVTKREILFNNQGNELIHINKVTKASFLPSETAKIRGFLDDADRPTQASCQWADLCGASFTDLKKKNHERRRLGRNAAARSLLQLRGQDYTATCASMYAGILLLWDGGVSWRYQVIVINSFEVNDAVFIFL